MGTTRVTLITLVLVSAFVEKGSQSADHQLQCRGSSFGISINSKINQTGHSITRYSIKKPEVPQRSWKLDYNTCVDDIAGSQVLTIEATITAAPPKPDDYEFFPGIGYYKLYTNPSNFSEALFRCSKDGGHLAIIN
ncbi:hemolymph lipopolysaccharide-binding protein-like [Ischnura elegans]|uniref:hemolymph lipopolysaccharide-binding protein-like n=1 Tax=Ischnura elegans TaxID=197161 RepID=UPI001ED88AF4|nr:hemolymph lipopolysaccharide-binding protein-like [Ischnura elegans]